jgi:ABC-type multidrug transport system fused ATPase/permease subunit
MGPPGTLLGVDAAAAPTASSASAGARDAAQPIRFLLALTQPYRTVIVVAVALAVVGSLAEAGALLALVGLATAVVRDGVTSVRLPVISHLVHTAGTIAWLGLGFVVARTALLLSSSAVSAHLSATLERDQRRSIYDAFLQADWATQVEMTTGSFQDLLLTSVEQVRRCIDALGRLLVAVIGFLAMFAAAMLVSWRTAIAMVVVGGALFLVVRPLSRIGFRFAARRAAVDVAFSEEVAQAIDHAREVRAFAAAPWFRQRMDPLLAELRLTRQRTELVSHSAAVLYQGLVMVTAFAALGLALATDADLLVTVGPAVLLLLRSLTYSQVAQQMGHQLQEFLPHAMRAREERDRLHARSAPHGTRRLDAILDLRLEDAWFTYPNGTPAAQGVTFSIRRGEIVGVVGPSGGGKSTLLQLLLRLREPQRGRLVVDGQPVEDVSLVSWAKNVAFVPQDAILIDGTIEENIRFGRDWVTGDDIRRAATQAGLADEIDELVAGFGHRVGEHGRRLSGGQRQRLCIARALAGHPDLLVFDEPTSALDELSENRIRSTIESLRGSVGVVLVAHRSSTLEVCDRVVVVADGRIVDDAPPADVDLPADGLEAAVDLAAPLSD